MGVILTASGYGLGKRNTLLLGRLGEVIGKKRWAPSIQQDYGNHPCLTPSNKINTKITKSLKKKNTL